MNEFIRAVVLLSFVLLWWRIKIALWRWGG